MFLSTVAVSFSNFIQVGFGFVFKWLYDFTSSNYALTVFLFALVVKLVMLPMSAKQKKTSLKTARLAPQLKILEAQCGDDKQLYQQEMARLYKEEGVSMSGTCLWSLIPLFILFPLYYVIREPLTYVVRMDMTDILALKSSHEYAANLGYWQLMAASQKGLMDFTMFGIDLSTTPNWRIWNASSWNDVGQFLLPVISGGLNLVQAFITQKMNATVSTNDNGEQDKDAAALANQSGKTMLYMMPLLSVLFGFMWPSGMSIYWIAQGLLGLIQDIILNKMYRKAYAKEDAERREQAKQKAAELAEKERQRAQRRAENPDGITANTSKKKLEQQKAAEREAAARAYAAANAPEPSAEDKAAKALSGDPERPFSRGRAYDPDHYRRSKDDTSKE